ncbi:MAG: hypothetical protein VXZ88_02140 [Verrucomicrobiota bacterium]|nr:hypothetical protein [Verrucomicrobiota bacterium]
MFITDKTFFPYAAVVALFFTACGAGISSTTVTIPDEPFAAMQTIGDEVIAGNYSILWHAMPTSYQTDINAIARLAGSKVDPEIYDKSFGLFGRFAEVADKQKLFILNTSLVGKQPAEQIAEIEAAWPSIIGFVQTIVTSSISSSAGLRAFDGQVFSEETLPELFKYSNDLAAISNEENPFGSLQFGSLKTVESTDTTAVLEITFASGDVVEAEVFTKVENRWVPAEIAINWSTGIVTARKHLQAISSEEIAKNKPQLMGMITMLDGILTQLNNAKTQEQFDQALQGAMIPIGLLVMQSMGEGIGAPTKPAAQ